MRQIQSSINSSLLYVFDEFKNMFALLLPVQQQKQRTSQTNNHRKTRMCKKNTFISQIDKMKKEGQRLFCTV